MADRRVFQFPSLADTIVNLRSIAKQKPQHQQSQQEETKTVET